MLEPLGNLIRRWRADPRPATTLALCQGLAEAGEAHRAAPPPGWPDYVATCEEVGRLVGERFALDLDVLLAAGRMHLAAGAPWDAQAATLQAAKIAPDEPRAWALLGEALLRRGDAARAARSLERAMAAGIRVDVRLYELAIAMAAHPEAARDAIAEAVTRALGYGARPAPPGVASLPVPAPSAPPPSVALPSPPRVPSLPRAPMSSAPRPDVPMAPGADEVGEATVRHEFDREELMALLRAADIGDLGPPPTSQHEVAIHDPHPPVVDEFSEDLATAQIPRFPRPPIQSDAFTLIRGTVDDDTTTETGAATAVGRLSADMVERLRAIERGGPIDVPRFSSDSGEVVPTIARQLAPRSRDAEHQPTLEVEEETTDRGFPDEETSGEGAAHTMELHHESFQVPQVRRPDTGPSARVIVDPPRRSAELPRPPALPTALPAPTQPIHVQRDTIDLPRLIEDSSHSSEMELPRVSPSETTGPSAVDQATERRRRPGRRRALTWGLGLGVAIAAGLFGARELHRRQAIGSRAEARDLVAQAREALETGDLLAARKLADRAQAQGEGDLEASRVAVEVRVMDVLDGSVAPEAAVDVLTFARKLGVSGSTLAAAALAASVGARNAEQAVMLLEQHGRDGLDRDDPYYRLAEGAAHDLAADPAAVAAYASARELAPSLGSAVVRHVRALVFAGRAGEAREAARGTKLPPQVANAIEVLLARADRPDRWPEREARIDRAVVGDLPRPLRAIGAALALVPPDSQGGSSMGLDAALDDADAPASLLLCGQLALAARDFEGALGAADRAVALRPGWTPAHALKARVLLLRGQLDEALAQVSSLPPAVAAELRAIAAYESGDASALAEAESRAVESGAARWPALALALARLRPGGKRPAPSEADGLISEGAVWADVLAIDLAIDAGDLERARKIAKGWPTPPDPSRALRLARLRRIEGDLQAAEKALAVAGDRRWAKVESVLLAAETRTERRRVIGELEGSRKGDRVLTGPKGLGELAPFALAYLRGRDGAFQAAKTALNKAKMSPSAPLEARVMALLGFAGARDTGQAGPYTDLVDALKGRPEVIWAGVVLGVLPPTRMPKGMK